MVSYKKKVVYGNSRFNLIFFVVVIVRIFFDEVITRITIILTYSEAFLCITRIYLLNDDIDNHHKFIIIEFYIQ